MPIVCLVTGKPSTGKYGRVAIPKLVLDLLKNDKPNLEGYIIEVILEPS